MDPSCAKLVVVSLLVACAAGCGGNSTGARSDAATGGPSPKATFTVDLAPARQLDMVFMIDNSDIAPKVKKMTDQLPRMLLELRDPASGVYPDGRHGAFGGAPGFERPNEDRWSAATLRAGPQAALAWLSR